MYVPTYETFLFLIFTGNINASKLLLTKKTSTHPTEWNYWNELESVYNTIMRVVLVPAMCKDFHKEVSLC